MKLAEQIWDLKYRYKDKNNIPIDKTVDDTWKRVARGIAQNEKNKEKWEKEFYNILKDYKFLPAGRIIANAGTNRKKATFFNCFVSGEIKDSIESIFDAVKNSALTQRMGGGIGFDFSNLRPKGAYVKGVEAQSSGPISFMEVFNATCSTISSAGQRRGAQLAALRCDHPDIELFIDAKRNNTSLTNFNLSVAITDKFMETVKNNEDWDLVFEGKTYKTISASYLWNKIMKSTYDYAEPGVLFVDTINKNNNLKYCENITTTNPCLVGDTLIAVADGREPISIKELAMDGNDVPVYCIDDKKDIVIKTMRHPRITGYKKPIYKITFNDGNSVKCTDNHKWLLSNFEYKEVKDLVVGDSLHLASKYKSCLDSVTKKHDIKDIPVENQKYWHIKNNQTNKTFFEHRKIYEQIDNIDGYIVHHKDNNGLNNDINNLQKMKSKQHNKHHAKEMIGKNNPMVRGKTEWSEAKWRQYHNNMSESISGVKNGRYLGGTIEEKKELIVDYCSRIGHSCSERTFIKYLKSIDVKPLSGIFKTSKYWNNLGLLIKDICRENNIPIVNTRTQTRLEKELNIIKQSNYDYRFCNDMYYVKKTCEYCGGIFEVPFSNHEKACCSRSCDYKMAQKKGRFDNYKNKKRIEQEEKLRTQAIFYSKLKTKYNRDLILSEWQDECKKENIPYQHRYGLVGYTWNSFINSVNNFNHTIVKIELSGCEDVYNGTVDEYHNFYCVLPEENGYSLINCKNCGEQALPPENSCLLGSINLTQFVKDKFTDNVSIDYNGIKKTITTAVRMLDDVIDISNFPLKEYEIETKNKRRMGIGITGLADVFAFCKIKYGSDNSVTLAETIIKTITNSAYLASIELAKEKGVFPSFIKEKFLKSKFIQNALSPETIKEIEKYGIRNSHLISIAPTGTISLYAGNVSSGLEPIFALSYNRKVRMDGGEVTQEVVDYAVEQYRKLYNTDKLPGYFITTDKISPNQHIKIQAILQKYVDSSISKTINVSENFPYEDFKNIYITAFESGLKGCTTFRPNPKRQGILIKTEDNTFPMVAKLKRPEKLNCDIHRFRAGGEDWIAFVSLLENRPYEVFAGHYSEECITLPKKYENACIIKKKLKNKSRYTLELNNGDISVNDIILYFPGNDELYGAQTRLISMCLRTGLQVKDIVEQLHKTNCKDFHHFNLGMARVLKHYISDGEISNNTCEKCGGKLVYQSGCSTCCDCGYSKCS